MTHHMLIALSALAGLLVIAAALLKGWRDWLTLKERELEARRLPTPAEHSSAECQRTREGITRIELADLKERIRKLEAIASGVDL